jgi:hypothetical protein
MVRMGASAPEGAVVLFDGSAHVPGVTGAAIDQEIFRSGPLLLQDHGDLVCYRNIRVVELPAAASTGYGPA